MEPENHPIEPARVGDSVDETAPDEAAAAPAEIAEDVAVEPESDGEIGGPSVDELEGRLSAVEAAMGHLQAGQLDDAEAAIASLDQRISSASD